MNAHANIVLQQAESKTHSPEIPWSDWREFSYEGIPGLAGELYKETESRACIFRPIMNTDSGST
ncbi:hypothetical protein [Aeromonas veronii]|uniref:hypothetical protein n=1 Tax=Aeromonas veronii TaxID=654 RepID=UPI00300712C3